MVARGSKAIIFCSQERHVQRIVNVHRILITHTMYDGFFFLFCVFKVITVTGIRARVQRREESCHAADKK